MKKSLLALLLFGAWTVPAPAEEAITFNKHIAPLLWKNCAECHHTGHVGPFPLLTYKDAAKRATFLRDITASRRMPPWRAEPGYGPFQNERRLSDAEIQLITKWVEGGAPEGDAKDLPPAPRYPEGWQLGKPDVIVKMPTPFKVPADGPDVYRCFVIPMSIDEDKTVAAVEFHPGNRRVIHHAAFHLDNKGLARQKEKETSDGQPGYSSFGGPGIPTVGRLSGWGLAALPRFLPEGTGMILPKGCDMVMQIHYHPTGKEETDQSEVGIYFARKPATRYFSGFSARATDISIPAGDKRHRVTCESVPLPVDVTVLTVTPHMHFLGKEVSATAVLPNGKSIPLIGIKDWDFHWHERYQFVRPLELPKGTVLKVEAIYDNSADNPKNPNNPPKLVKYGNNLTDEMLSCNLEIITASLADLRILEGMRMNRRGSGPPEESKPGVPDPQRKPSSKDK